MQSELTFPNGWGGRREGSGRAKRKSGTAHCSRQGLSGHDPMLITWKRVKGLGSFRREQEAEVIVLAIKAARRPEFRIVHFSIQADHLHMLIEADSRQDMASGMRGLGCRLGRGLNKLWQRRGKVFAERFHERILKSLRQVRNALRYVLNNHRKHGFRSRPDRPDVFSSGFYFDGWTDCPRKHDPAGPGSLVSPPGWVLGVGWLEFYGPIPVGSVPG